jgi:exonuclease III
MSEPVKDDRHGFGPHLHAFAECTGMRIVSWNCNGGLRKKHLSLDELGADLLVIQEASARDVGELDAPFTYWVGRPGGKGIAIVANTGASFRVHESYCPDLPWFIPVQVGPIRLLAVWACVATSRLRYVRLVHAALDHYAAFLTPAPAIVIGDLNSNAIFDRKHGTATHTRLVDRLGNLGLASVYHIQTGESHGDETTPTFFLYRHRDKPYHFDYAFVSEEILPASRLLIGSPEQWLSLSDHLPLIVDLPDHPVPGDNHGDH